MTLLETFASTVELTTYADVREALFHPDLSRTFDTRGYAEGNIRDGIVSIQHGAVHRARRRVENAQFRPDKLKLYERELFPAVMADLLDVLMHGDEVDLYPIGETLACVLASRRVGLDIREGDLAELARIVDIVDTFSQGAAILDAKDPEAVRARVYAVYEEFERDYVRPAWARREALLDAVGRGELEPDALPHDILTALLQHRAEPGLELGDDGRIVREIATYLQGGTHTSGQILVNAVDLMFELLPEPPDILDRVAADLLVAQRVVHETLRVRPTTPRIRRRTFADVTIGDRAIPADSLVVLDVVKANQDPRFGPAPERFDPDREVGPDVPRWGLSFGGGAHVCPGRTVGGGFPVPASGEVDDDHLYGLVARMIQEIVRRGIEPLPGRVQERDTRTERFTRWAHYWVGLGAPRQAAVAAGG